MSNSRTVQIMDTTSVLLFTSLAMPSLAYGVGFVRHQYRERAWEADNDILRGIIAAQNAQIKALEIRRDQRPIRLDGLVGEAMRLKIRSSYCPQCKPSLSAENTWHA